MKTIRIALNRHLSSKSLDARLGQLACYLGAIAVVPTSVVALIKHPGSRADLVFGLALTGLVGLLLVSLGMLCRRGVGSRDGVSPRSRWTEFASIPTCVVLLVMGIRWLAGLGLTPAQVTLGLLMTCALSLAVLVLGMTTTVIRSLEG
jgi:hypothetical protein